MTTTERFFPPINVATKPKPRPKQRGYDATGTKATRPRTKYDHAQMLQDRLGGMTWLEVAQRHGVAANRPDARRGTEAFHLCMNSAAAKRLTPAQVEQLQDAPDLHRRGRPNQ